MAQAVQTQRVRLGERSYTIAVGQGLIDDVGPRIQEGLAPSRVGVVADTTVDRLYGSRVQGSLQAAGIQAARISFPPGEDAKNLDQVRTLYDALFEAGLDRKSAVVALGGGVTGDLAGFAAATFMRGIPFVQVPTSLLAMVDSSSGGKTGVNLPRGKNLIGAFHQPALVVIDPATLQTLSREELLSGLAEVVKHGVIRDAAYFGLVEAESQRILALDSDVLDPLILGSCRIKAAVVAADEREGGLRAILNFGHTFGHAFESLSAYTLRHGEAVAVGMVAACRLAERLRGLDPEVGRRLGDVLRALGLPVAVDGFAPADVLAAMRGDKKTEHGRLRVILPVRLGEVEIVEVEDEAAVRAAIESVVT